MPLPARFIGSDYYLVDLDVGERRLTMLLDTGMTASVMLLDSTCELLGLSGKGSQSQSIGATGNMWMQTVELAGASVAPAAGGQAVPLPALQGCMKQDFPQRMIGREVGVTIHGMLGQGFLEHCDLEVDPTSGVLRLYRPAMLPSAAAGWTALTPLNLPGELFGLLLSVPSGSAPVLGIVDTGASHTVVNTRAAKILGLEEQLWRSERQPPELRRVVRGIGLDHSTLMMPLVNVSGAYLCAASEVTIVQHGLPRGSVGALKAWSFGNTTCSPHDRVGPLGGVQLAVGDIGFFKELLSQGQDSIGDFEGAVALLGQDFLGQLPFRVSVARKRLWMKQDEPYDWRSGL